MDKYCRFLFATFITLAVFETTVDAQTYYGAYPGDVYATTYAVRETVPAGSYYGMPGCQQLPVQAVAASAYTAYPYPTAPFAAVPPAASAATPSTRTLPPMTAVDPKNPPQDLNYLYFNRRDQDGTVQVPVPKPAPQTAPTSPKTADDAAQNTNPAGEPVSQSETTAAPATRWSARVANNYRFYDESMPVPNMIGDSTSMPTKLLTYSFLTTEEVQTPNPNYTPWPEDVHTDISSGNGTVENGTTNGSTTGTTGGLNVNDGLLEYLPDGTTVTDGSAQTGNTVSRDQYIVTQEVVRKNIAVPMPVTPTMYITSLNMAENFNADAQDRFYVDLRYFGGGESFGVAVDSGEVFTSRTDMSRMTFGFEKKLGDNHSVELRLPLVLVGLKSSQKIVGNGKAEHSTEFGNLSIVYKNVLKKTHEAVFCWGIGLNTPTAPDMKLHYQPIGGADPIRGTIDNRKVSFVPYFGFQWNRENRTFGHLVAQADVAVGKNRMDFTDRRYGETRYRADMKEYSLLRFNVGTGRWIYENPIDASLFRLGLMAECHFTTNLDVVDPMVVRSSGASSDNYFSTTTRKRNWTNINVIFGIPIHTRRTTLTTFIGVPITNTRYYDVEGGISADIRF